MCAPCGGTIVLAAQAPAQTPTFRSGADVVEVDVQVSERSGQPIVDLARDEWTLLVDGQPRAIATIDHVAYGAAPPAAGRPDDPAGLAVAAASFSTNAQTTPGRLFALVVDQGNLTRGGGRGAMEAAGRFLDRLSPADRAALVTLPAGPAVDFTADHALVKASAAKVVGGGANGYQGSFSRTISLAEAFAFVTGSQRRLFTRAVSEECASSRFDSEVVSCQAEMEGEARQIVATAQAAAQATVKTLETLFDRLAAIDGPKHVVFIGQGLVTGSSFGSLDGLADLAWIADKSHTARATLYVVQLGNPFLESFDVSERRPTRTPVEDSRLIEDGLVEMAGIAGGSLFRLSGKLDPAFEHIARESSASYVLRFDVAASDRDGKAHPIEVRVKRAGASVRARKSFVAPAPGTRSDASAGRRLGMALRAPLVPLALTIDLTTTVMREAGATTRRLLVAAEIGCGPQPPSAADVALALTAADGTTTALPPENTAAIVPRGADECLYDVSTVRVPPGDARVRFAAVSADGRSGAVNRSVEAGAAQGGGLRLGGLLLTDPGVRIAGRMKQVVDGTVRDRVAAYVEADWVDGPPPAAAPRLTFEVAPGVDAPAAVAMPVEMIQDEPGRWYAEATIELKALAPGRYVLRAVAAPDGAEPVRTARLLRIVP